MRKILTAIATLLVALVFTGCTVIEPGYEGIKIDRMGDTRGIDNVSVEVGFTPYNLLTQDVIVYPVSVQRVVWTAEDTRESPGNEAITVNTSEGVILTIDASIALYVEPGSSPVIYTKYRKTLDQLIDGVIRDIVREGLAEAAQTRTADEILGDGRAPFESEAEQLITTRLAREGIVVDNFSIINRIDAPDRIEEQINLKIEAAQAAIAAENRVRQIEAEAQQRIAAAEGERQAAVLRAQGEAEALTILNQALVNNPDVLQLRAIEAWDGVLPRVITGDATALSIFTSPQE